MTKLKIILFDIESIPDLGQVMKVYPGLSAYPGLTLKATHTSLLCFGYKQLGSKKTHCLNVWDTKSGRKFINNDKELLIKVHEILQKADVVVTHNGRSFDWKHLQTRFMLNGLVPLHDIVHIDTKHLAKRNLYLLNNKLDTLGEYLVNEKKLDNGGWKLWVDVQAGKKKAKDLMVKYCKQDVALLEKVFKKLLPFVKNMPNYNMLFDSDTRYCPNCGAIKHRRNGHKFTKVGKFPRFQCLKCYTNFFGPKVTKAQRYKT